MLHKVLAVASTEQSRQPAFELIGDLKEYGYSVDLCHSPDKEGVNLKADRALVEDMSLGEYEGVIFFDDGGNLKECVSLAKRADDEEKVVAGYSVGTVILSKAGILEGKFVCKGLDKEAYEEAKMVNSPAVRCKNVITSMQSCSSGFNILILDALGGEIHRIVTSAKPEEPLPEPLPVKSALVISRMERWPEYWGLAEKLAANGTSLVLADWQDIDVKARKLSRLMLFDVKASDVRLASNSSIPRKVWFKQTCIGALESVDAVAALERMGCVNINSSEAMRLAMNKAMALSVLEPLHGGMALCDAEIASEELLKSGTRWARASSSSSNRPAIKVVGLGDSAIVSRHGEHRRMDRKALAASLRTSFNHEPFIVQPQFGGLRIGPHAFSLRFVMRRGEAGWKSACELARAEGMACPAKTAMRIGFPEDWEARLASARDVAAAACVTLQSEISDPEAVRELGVDVSATDLPMVIGVTGAPSLAMPDVAASGEAMLALAFSVGIEAKPEADEPGDPREGAAEFLAEDDELHKHLCEREMAHEGIWMQPDGTVALQDEKGVRKFPVDGAIEQLRKEAVAAVRREIKEEADKAGARRLALASRRARHRLHLLLEFERVGPASKKFASIYPNTISGPFAHVDLPMFERVFEWNEGDDYLKDDKQTRDQPRYNPEYDKDQEKDSYGFYYIWDEPRRSPTDWYRNLEGDGVYRTRVVLRH